MSWLVVWNINFIFPYIGNNHPNWLIFFRGVQATNQWELCTTSWEWQTTPRVDRFWFYLVLVVDDMKGGDSSWLLVQICQNWEVVGYQLTRMYGHHKDRQVVAWCYGWYVGLQCPIISIFLWGKPLPPPPASVDSTSHDPTHWIVNH